MGEQNKDCSVCALLLSSVRAVERIRTIIDASPAASPACKNPHESCSSVPSRWFDGLYLCTRCYYRFKRHNDGKKRQPWGLIYPKAAKP